MPISVPSARRIRKPVAHLPIVIPVSPGSTPRLSTATTIAISIPTVSEELPAERAPPPNKRLISVLKATIATRMM